MSRLMPREVNEEQTKRIQDLNVAARYLEYRINNLCPKGRERKIALQRLEEVVMWANKAIAYEGADK